MTVDYDVRRRSTTEEQDDSLDLLATPAGPEIDDGDDSYDLPDADFATDELLVRVIPKQADEFTCSSCFLVHHRSRLAAGRDGGTICTDCA